MPLILTTPPVAEPISLAETKAHLRISHADDDAYLTRLIATARKLIEQRLSLAIMPQSWSLFLDCWPENGTIAIPLAPVTAIADVIIHSDSDTPATLDPAHYYLDRVSKPARLALRCDRTLPQAGRVVNGIEFRFMAGFANPPDDIKQALLITLASWFGDRGEQQLATLPQAARDLLAPYRQVRLT